MLPLDVQTRKQEIIKSRIYNLQFLNLASNDIGDEGAKNLKLPTY